MMKKSLLFLILCGFFVVSVFAQVQPSQKLSLRKLSKIADKRAGRYNSGKENPQRRYELEMKMQVDPMTGKIPEGVKEKEVQYVKSSRANLQKPSNLFGVNTGGVNWNNRGPYNVGGRTRALAIDVTNENVLLAGGVSGGVFRSVDGGQNWVKTTGASQLHSVTSIAQDTRPGFENIWYYTTGEMRGNSASKGDALYCGNGVFKSVDGGQSWNLLPSTASEASQIFDSFFDFNWRVLVNPVNGEVLVASYGCIQKSSDGGDSWEQVLMDMESRYTDVAVSSTGVYYATMSAGSPESSGVFRSINGVNWINITPSAFPSSFNRIALSIAPSNEDVLYFIAETPSVGVFDHSLYRYTYVDNIGNGSGDEDNGGVWTNLSANIPSYGAPVGDFNSQGSYDLVIGVHPANSNVVFLGGTNVYRSTDGFTSTNNTTWIGGYHTNNDISQYPQQHPDIHAFAFYPSNPNHMLCGNDGGVTKTTNNLLNESDGTPVNWVELNNGYITTQAYSVAIDQSGTDDLIMTGFQDNGTWSTDNTSSTASWIEEFSGDGSYCAFAHNGTVRYVSSQNANIYRFVYDEFGNFDAFSRVKPAILVDPLFITPFVLDPNNEDIMYLPDADKILRNSALSQIPIYSNDPATNWTALNNTTVSAVITSLDISTNPANILIYGTDDGKVYKVNNANSGDPISSEITGAGFPEGAYVSCVKIDPSDANTVFVVFSSYNVKSVFMTADGGQNWTDISGNLEENPDGSGSGPSVRWFEILDLGGGEIAYFAGTSTGLYSTQVLNGSATSWSQEGANTLGNVVVPMIKTREDGTVVVATHANGVYSAKFSSSVVTAPIADFSADIQEVTVGGTVNFSDQSQNGPTSWKWTFEGANTETSSLQHPKAIMYDYPGCYKVDLVTANIAGSDVVSKSCYINVVAPQLSCGCDTLNNVGALEEITAYSMGADGYFPGHNSYGMTFYAEKFTASQSANIAGVAFDLMYVLDSGNGGEITVGVWNDVSGYPAENLYSQSISLADLTDEASTNLAFSSPVEVSGDYYVSIGLNYNGDGDTVVIGTAADRGFDGMNTAYIYWEGWEKASDVAVDYSSSHAIRSFLCTQGTVYTTDTIEVCANSSYTYLDGTEATHLLSDESHSSTIASQEDACDSVITEYLLVVEAYQQSIDTSVCFGQIYQTPEGIQVDPSGDRFETITTRFTSLGGCDSIVTVNVTERKETKVVLNQPLCYGGEYTFADGAHITDLTKAESRTTVLESLLTGCDSIVVENITILPVIENVVDVDVCYGETYTTALGTVVDPGENGFASHMETLKTSDGCDSVLVINVTEMSENKVLLYPEVCFLGSFVYADGLKVNNISGSESHTSVLSSLVTGCDSIVVEKIIVKPLVQTVVDTTICNASVFITPQGVVVDPSGDGFESYSEKLQSIDGCDSLVIYNVTEAEKVSVYLNQEVCYGGDYTYVNGTVSSAIIADEMYVSVLTSVLTGCDSVVVESVSVLPMIESTVTVGVCDGEEYVSPQGTVVKSSQVIEELEQTVTGCDSLVRIEVDFIDHAFAQITETACDEYYSPSGKLFTTSQLLRDTVENSYGCDSIIDIDLRIVRLNDSIYVENNTLYAVATQATYQWLDCDNGEMPLTGEVSEQYHPEVSGNYALELSEAGCVVVTECEYIDVTSVASSKELVVKLYPNPTQGLLLIHNNNNKDIQFIIRDKTGRQLHQGILNSNTGKIDLSAYAKGVYFVDLIIEGKISRNKVVKM